MSSPLTARTVNKRQPLTPTERNQRRKLIFQDSLALIGLTLITICIAILTYYFFNSFTDHRKVLEQRWFARGQQAIAANDPRDAVQAFRSALSLSAGNTKYQLALAEALAKANHNDEAYAYFSALHDAEPGDGFLNLQMARLAIKRDNPEQAIGFYRSALTGLWYGQGTEQRFQIRLELARYLMSLGKNTEAQGDLLTAVGNSLDRPAQLLEVAALLHQAGDPADAISTYRRVELHTGATPSQTIAALQGEVEAAMAMGQYKQAAQAVDRYNAKIRQHPHAISRDEKMTAQLQQDKLHRLLQLIPFASLGRQQYARRVLSGANIAHKRYLECSATLQTGPDRNVSGKDSAALSDLGAQWTQMQPLQTRNLVGNASRLQAAIGWTNRTEILTDKLCGAPTGENALLLQLAQTPDRSE